MDNHTSTSKLRAPGIGIIVATIQLCLSLLRCSTYLFFKAPSSFFTNYMAGQIWQRTLYQPSTFAHPLIPFCCFLLCSQDNTVRPPFSPLASLHGLWLPSLINFVHFFQSIRWVASCPVSSFSSGAVLKFPSSFMTLLVVTQFAPLDWLCQFLFGAYHHAQHNIFFFRLISLKSDLLFPLHCVLLMNLDSLFFTSLDLLWVPSASMPRLPQNLYLVLLNSLFIV